MNKCRIWSTDDGNGRIARAIADMALARSEHSAQRFYSMSAQIRIERKAYYEILEATQKSDLDVTPWLGPCLNRYNPIISGHAAAPHESRSPHRFHDNRADYA